jgi:hypothetical protein
MSIGRRPRSVSCRCPSARHQSVALERERSSLDYREAAIAVREIKWTEPQTRRCPNR